VKYPAVRNSVTVVDYVKFHEVTRVKSVADKMDYPSLPCSISVANYLKYPAVQRRISVVAHVMKRDTV